jgi:hypothetical protein
MIEILNNNCFKKFSTLIKYRINPGALNLAFNMLNMDKHNRISPESIIEDRYFIDNLQNMDVKIIKNLVDYDYNYLQKLKFKIKNLKAYHNLIYYLFFNLKNYFMNIEETFLLNNFYNYLDSNKDGVCKKSEIEEILTKTKGISTSNINSYIDMLDTILDNELHGNEIFNNGIQKDAFSYEHFLVGNMILKMYYNRQSDSVKRGVKVMFYELDLDHNNTISIEEIEEVAKYEKKDYVKNLLKNIINDPFYEPIISDFNNISLSEIENLLFYDCIFISDQQKQILETRKV